MIASAQAKVLRVLQSGEFTRVGGEQTLKVDVRVVAATNRNLEDDIKRGRFRSDLFYRLNVIQINLPPLRDRREDIPIFVNAFLERIAGERSEPPKALAEDGARERARAGRHADQGRRHPALRDPRPDQRAQGGAARGGAAAQEPGARRDRAGVHHVGAAERRR
jgi:hypothetical protein